MRTFEPEDDMAKKGMTYADAGVDIDLKSRSISALVKKLGRSRKGGFAPLELPGHFTGLIDFGEHALSLCTDGVGTKLIVAEKMDIWNTVGIDCIAMNVNDTICVGAEPVAFVDYIAVDRPRPDTLAQIGEGLQKGAEMSNMVIVGGEVAIMPEVVRGIDLTGTCLGIVRKEEIISGTRCSPGDRIVGLASSGIHSNGLSLARKIVEESGLDYRDRIEALGKSIGEELLTPTRIYVEDVLRMVRNHRVHGMINLTGGGVRNFLRLKEGLGFSLDEPMQPQPVFGFLQELGSVDEREMYQTFNMGMGFAIVAPEESAIKIVDDLKIGAKIVGSVNDTGSVTIPPLDLGYDRY